MQVERPDHHVYHWVSFFRETIEFLVSSVKFYESLLKSEEDRINADVHLGSFLSSETRREFRIGRGLQQANRHRQWLEDLLSAKDASDLDVDTSIDHGTVRYLKSVGLLYLGFIKQKRNSFSSEPNVTANFVSAIDREITRREETLNQTGVFANASTIPLLADQSLPYDAHLPRDKDNKQESIAAASRPTPVIVDSIELLDEELRHRCLDLFDKFQESGQHERHDTVVAEATRILENRLRLLTKTNDGATGTELVKRAFGGTKPLILVSHIPAEQEAVHHLFRGVFGFIRNPVHHRFLTDLSSQRVLQVLGLIDYLISVMNAALITERQE